MFNSLPGKLEKEWMRQSADADFIRYLSVGNVEFVVPISLRAIKEVLQTNCYSFIKPPFWWRVVGEIAGKGILFLEGEEHKKQRKLLAGITLKLCLCPPFEADEHFGNSSILFWQHQEFLALVRSKSKGAISQNINGFKN